MSIAWHFGAKMFASTYYGPVSDAVLTLLLRSFVSVKYIIWRSFVHFVIRREMVVARSGGISEIVLARSGGISKIAVARSGGF